MRQHPAALAVLSALPATGLAILAADLGAGNGGWRQLLPAGRFQARDGRPFDVPDRHWVLNGHIAERLINQVRLHANDLLIDYEHQTLHAETNGQPAPAAGWVSPDDIQWRDGQGLFIRPRWTAPAKQAIAPGPDGEPPAYQYLSAVFSYDQATGEPLELRMAALTNDPGVTGMESLAALAAQKFAPATSPHRNEDTPMNEAQKLLALLGIEVAEGDAITAEHMATAEAALTALKAKADQATEAQAALTAAKRQAGEVDLSRYVPKPAYDATVAELAALKADSEGNGISTAINTAREEGRILAGEVDYLTQFGQQQGLAELTAMLAARAPLTALKASQTKDKQPERKDAELTTADLAVLKATGISREDFIKTKGEQA